MRPHFTFPGGERPEVLVSGSLRRILSRTELPFLQENRSQSWSGSGRIFRGDGDRMGYRGRPSKNHCEEVDLPFPHVHPVGISEMLVGKLHGRSRADLTGV